MRHLQPSPVPHWSALQPAFPATLARSHARWRSLSCSLRACSALKIDPPFVRSLTSALKLVNYYKIAPLAERISMLMEAKYDEGERDVEQPPPRQPPPRARAPSQRAPAPLTEEEEAAAPEEEEEAAEEEEEVVAEEEEEAAQPAEAPQPINPFARSASATANAGSKVAPAVGKVVSAPDTSKSGKRKMPVTGSVAKSAKK